MRSTVAFAVLLSVALAVGSVSARPGSLERLAADLQRAATPTIVEMLARGHRLGLAVAPSLSTPAASSFAERLSRRLATLPARDGRPSMTLERIEPAPTADPGRAAQVLEARLRGWTRLLRVEVVVRQGRLLLVGELIPTDDLLWDRVLKPVAGVVAHFFAAHRLDAELRALLALPASPRPSAWQLRALPLSGQGEGKAGRVPGRILALAVGDVDADGDPELLVLTRDVLLVGRVSGEGFITTTAPYRLNQLPRAAVRSREPMGALLVADILGDARDEILLSTSDLARSVVLEVSGSELRPVEALSDSGRKTCDGEEPAPNTTEDVDGRLLLCGRPVGVGDDGAVLLQRATRGRAAYSGRVLRWHVGAGVDPAPPMRGAGEGALRRWIKLPEPGAWLTIDAGVSHAGTLCLHRADRSDAVGEVWRRLEGVGFAFELTDLDDDGQVEIVTTSSAPPGEPDSVSIWSISSSGSEEATPLRRWRARTDSVQAIVAGDVDGDGRVDLVAGTWRFGAGDSSLMAIVPEE